MKLDKVAEIYNSRGVINVTYKSNPVWIENIQKESQTAQIRDLKTDELKEVSVLELKEE